MQSYHTLKLLPNKDNKRVYSRNKYIESREQYIVNEHVYICQSQNSINMSETTEQVLSDAGDHMKKAIKHLETELSRIRAGKANPQILDGVMVEYYGSPTPLNQVANVTTPDARTIQIQPWEKPLLQDIERAIIASNVGLNPQNDGEIIRLFLPPLTEERRKELVKRVNAEGEQAKISVRNIRRDAIEQVKKLQKGGLSEDAAKGAEGEVQNLTDTYIAKIDQHCKDKDKEIMTV